MKPRRLPCLPARRSLLAVSILASAACVGLFGSDFEIDFQAEVVGVTTSGGETTCDVVIEATAVGEEEEQGVFGEAIFTFRSLEDGRLLATERRSAAFMGARFGSEVIASGETRTTGVLQRAFGGPFEWSMELNYRKPGRLRGTDEVVVTCR